MYPFNYDEEAQRGNQPFGQPSFGQPPSGQPPFGQPSFGGGGGGGQMQPPTAPPPNFTPQQYTTAQQQEFSRRGGVGSIRHCMFRNTFVWLWNGNSFWFFPMVIAGNSIIGFRWRGGRRGWVYDSINRNNIAFFQCY